MANPNGRDPNAAGNHGRVRLSRATKRCRTGADARARSGSLAVLSPKVAVAGPPFSGDLAHHPDAATLGLEFLARRRGLLCARRERALPGLSFGRGSLTQSDLITK